MCVCVYICIFFFFQVLSVLDSNYHIFNDVKKSSVPLPTEKRLCDHSLVRASEYKEKISICVPYIGISLIDSYPQVIELATFLFYFWISSPSLFLLIIILFL